MTRSSRRATSVGALLCAMALSACDANPSLLAPATPAASLAASSPTSAPTALTASAATCPTAVDPDNLLPPGTDWGLSFTGSSSGQTTHAVVTHCPSHGIHPEAYRGLASFHFPNGLVGELTITDIAMLIGDTLPSRNPHWMTPAALQISGTFLDSQHSRVQNVRLTLQPQADAIDTDVDVPGIASLWLCTDNTFKRCFPGGLPVSGTLHHERRGFPQ